jgi:PAS domain S-box-containing protein
MALAAMLRNLGRSHVRDQIARRVERVSTRCDNFVLPSRTTLTRRYRKQLAALRLSDQPWRLIVGIGSVVLPAIVLGLLFPDLPVTTPGMVLLISLSFATYLADWVGGVSGLLVATIALNTFYIGDRWAIDTPRDASEAAGYGVTLLAGGVLIWMIERIRHQSVVDRRAALAAKSAATALASLETVAASQAPGDEAARRQMFDSVVRALVGIHRAHAGALYISADTGSDLKLAASYGFGDAGIGSPLAPSITDQFALAVARMGRPFAVADVSRDPRFSRSNQERLGIRAMLGAPVLGQNDEELGVVMIGLLVPHQFTATEIAKIDALARQVAAIVATATAVDARDLLVKRAQDEQHRLELVIAAMPEAVILAAPPDGKIIAANDAALALFGRLDHGDLSRHLSQTCGDRCPHDEMPVVTALKTGEALMGIELLARHVNGTDVPVLASAAPVREPDGTIVAVVAVFRDIAELKQASKMKDEFVSVVSHELRSPLTPIRGFVQLVAKELDREGGHDSQVQRLRSLNGHVDRMTRLVDDLLEVSRLKAGPLEIRRGPTDLIEIAREVVQVRASAGTHQVDFDAQSTEMVGDWDRDRLHQVVDNLTGNALKYTPEGGKVTVSIGLDPRTHDAVLTVADNGPGIGPEDRERIFTAFYRTRSAETSRIAGLGLGLYICHELVLAHGGTIEVGESPSGGAAFTVRLPLAAEALAA